MFMPDRPAGEPAQKNLPPLTQAPSISLPQEQTSGPFNDPDLDRYFAALMAGDDKLADRVAMEFAQSPQGQEMAQQGQQLLAEQQRQQEQLLQTAQQQVAPVIRV